MASWRRWSAAWGQLTGVGLDGSVERQRARAIRVLNVGLVVMVLLNLGSLPVFLRFLPASREICCLEVAAMAAFAAILGLNVRGHFSLARLLTLIVGGVQVVSCSLLAGLESGYHLFLLLMFAGVFVVFPQRERWARRVLLAFGGASFLGLVLLDVQRSSFGAEVLRQMALVNGAGLILLMVVVSAHNSQVIEAWERRAEAERVRAERLLLNILPERIARLLDDDRPAIAEGFDDVTVLFCDIVEFLRLTAPLEPMAQVRLLDTLFSAFDRLAEEHGLEKIKTIGDAYMVAGGVPDRMEGHCEAVARLALDMLQVKERLELGIDEPLRLRIGIARGPVVAGVIGRQKFSYDLWGELVNTASRMESHGLPDRIQITAEVARSLQDRFLVERRGVVHIKGKGPMETWFLCGYPTTTAHADPSAAPGTSPDRAGPPATTS